MTALDRSKNEALIKRTQWTRILKSSLFSKYETLEKKLIGAEILASALFVIQGVPITLTRSIGVVFMSS